VIHFIHGPDRLLARNAAQAIAREVDPDGVGTSWLDGKQTSIDRIIADVGTRSFFATPRVIVVTDLLGGGSQQPADAAAGASGRRSKPSPDLARLFASVPEEHHLILLEAELSGPPAIVKSLPAPVQIVAAEPPRGAALLAWITASAKNAGAEIEPVAARELARAHFPQTWERKSNNPRYDVPPDLTLLEHEIEKLAVAAHPHRITAALVKSLVAGNPDTRLFRFIEAAMAGDLTTATAELHQLQVANEEPAALLAHLLGQIEISAVVAAAGARDAASVARDLNSVTAGRVSAAATAAKRRPTAALAAVSVGTRIDRELKTGRVRRPEEAVHNLLAALASSASDTSGTR
jgi:DNA polymerase III delta subunit